MSSVLSLSLISLIKNGKSLLMSEKYNSYGKEKVRNIYSSNALFITYYWNSSRRTSYFKQFNENKWN